MFPSLIDWWAPPHYISWTIRWITQWIFSLVKLTESEFSHYLSLLLFQLLYWDVESYPRLSCFIFLRLFAWKILHEFTKFQFLLRPIGERHKDSHFLPLSQPAHEIDVHVKVWWICVDQEAKEIGQKRPTLIISFILIL